MSSTRPFLLRVLCGVLYCVGATPAFAQAPAGVTTFGTARSWVVLAIPSVRDIADERVRLGDAIAECRETIDISPDDSAAFVSREWPPFALSQLPARSIVEITVTPRARFPVNCGNPSRTVGLLEDRAQWIAYDTPLTADQRIAAVRVTFGGRELSPLATDRSVLRRLGPRGYAPVIGEAVRLAFRLEDLAPSEVGESPELAIHIESEIGVLSESIVITWPTLRDVWDATLAVRARALAPRSPPLDLPAPKDSMLQQAHTAYTTGAMSTAARVANRRLRQGKLSEQDVLWARALSAAVFGAANDSLATWLSLEYLAEIEPCLRWGEAAPSLVQSMANQVDRPSRRCEAVSMPRIVVRSLLMPGFGRPPEEQGTFFPRAVVATAIVGAAAYSQVLRRSARENYEEYLRRRDLNTPAALLTALYTKARDEQMRGQRVVQVAFIAYVAQAGVSALLEWEMKRRLNSVMPYGAPARRVGLRVHQESSRVGLGVRWTW